MERTLNKCLMAYGLAATFVAMTVAAPAVPTAHAESPQSKTESATPPQGHPVVPRSETAPVQFRVGRGNVKSILADDDSVWVGTSGGLIHFSPRQHRYRQYDNSSGLLSNGVFYIGKVRGEIWVGTYGGGLSVFNPNTEKWRNYNIPNGMGDAFVYDVIETRSGDVWIATWSGANRVVQGRMDDIDSWQLYTVENTHGGLPNDWVYGLAEGVNGEIWLATEGGLARFANDEWHNWKHADGLGAPYELVEADMPFKNDPGEVSSHHARQKVEQGLEGVKVAYNPNYIVSLTVDKQGDVWAGTWGGGLSRFNGTSWATYTVRDGLPGNHVFALGTDSVGRVWIGTSRGLAKYDSGQFVRYGLADGLYSEVIFSIEFTETGAAWVGGLGGVAWFPKGLQQPHTRG